MQLKPSSTRIRVNGKNLNKKYWKRWHVLANLINEQEWETGLELGVKDGKTIWHILKFCPKIFMYGIDCWEPVQNANGDESKLYDDWNHQRYYKDAKIRAVKGRAKLIKGYTQDVHNQIPDNSLDFIFVDADHSHDAVKKDIELYKPKLKPTGVMLGHNIDWESVRTAVLYHYSDFKVHPNNVWEAIEPNN